MKLIACLLVTTFLAAGCGHGSFSGSGDNDASSYAAKAKELADKHDYHGAATNYEKALRAEPELASAHFELAVLCDQNLNDPAGAIYHYRQYLVLQPNSEKRQLIQDLIERATLTLATKAPQSAIADPKELTRLQDEKAVLAQENAALKTRIAELERAVQSTTTAATGFAATNANSSDMTLPPTPSVPLPSTAAISAAAPQTTPPFTIDPSKIVAATPSAATVIGMEAASFGQKTRSHVVQRGDTLQSLALRYYGNRSAWERIFQANRGILPSKDQLRVGQTLVIP